MVKENADADDDEDDGDDDDDNDERLFCLYRPGSTSSCMCSLTLCINSTSQRRHRYETMQTLRVLLRR